MLKMKLLVILVSVQTMHALQLSPNIDYSRRTVSLAMLDIFWLGMLCLRDENVAFCY